MVKNAKLCGESGVYKDVLSGLNSSSIGALLAKTLRDGGDVTWMLLAISNANAPHNAPRANVDDLSGTTRIFKPKLPVQHCCHIADFDSPSLAYAHQLRVRHEYMIDALYDDQAFQCVQTGRRFRTKEALDAHLDEVHARRRKRKEGPTSRNWMVPAVSWAFGDAQMNSVAMEAPETPMNCSVPVDDAQPNCALSGESFETFWHCDEDEWHYKGAVMMRFPLGALRAGDIVLATNL